MTLESHIWDFGLSWYWALTFALCMLMASIKYGLCDDWHSKGGWANRTNRFTFGLVLIFLGLFLNVVTWGSNVTAGEFGLSAWTVQATDYVASVMRAVTRPIATVGALIAITGLSDDRREWLLAVGAVAAVFLATWFINIQT